MANRMTAICIDGLLRARRMHCWLTQYLVAQRGGIDLQHIELNLQKAVQLTVSKAKNKAKSMRNLPENNTHSILWLDVVPAKLVNGLPKMVRLFVER